MSAETPIARLDARIRNEGAHASAVRAMFERIAPTYDLLNRTLSAGLDVRWRKRAVAELEAASRPHVSGSAGAWSTPDCALLDLCAGTLDFTALLTATFPAARVVAVDFSERMLRLGHAKAPRAEIVVGDALGLPFKDGEFAAVVCGFGMRNLSDVARAAREVRRVLRPGGMFVTLDAFRPEHRIARWVHGAYTSVVFPALGGAVSGARAAYAYFADSVAGFVTRAAYEEILRDAGFGRVRGEDVLLGAASIVTGELDS